MTNINMYLTPNFTLSEMLYSDTAIKLGIENTATDDIVIKLKILCENVLQPVRNYFNKPVIINSGYRNPILNEAVKGSKTSQHAKGEAADIEIKGLSNYDLACWIRDNLNFDQLILEYADNLKNDPNSGWVHVSYVSPQINRKQCLTINKKGTFNGFNI